MLSVFLTVDTELWPFVPRWLVPGAPVQTDFSREWEIYINGTTPDGSYGIPFLLDVLGHYQLRATFFVESLAMPVTGIARWSDLVTTLGRQGHDVELHVHTEWMEELLDPRLPGWRRQHLREYDEAVQASIIAVATENLKGCGVSRVVAFRAGNFGSNAATLRALARNGIPFDTSHNIPYLDPDWDLRDDPHPLQPKTLDGVWEFPVTCFRDFPRHWRPAHLNSCSFAELEMLLVKAWRAGWYAFVIVMHSFEFIRRSDGVGRAGARPDQIVIDRMLRLAEFLATNRDKFRAEVFADLDPSAIPVMERVPPLKSSLAATARRLGEQLVGWWQ